MSDEPFLLKSVLDIELPTTVEGCHRLIRDRQICWAHLKRDFTRIFWV